MKDTKFDRKGSTTFYGEDQEDKVAADEEHGPGPHYQPRKRGSTVKYSSDPEDRVAGKVGRKKIRQVRAFVRSDG